MSEGFCRQASARRFILIGQMALITYVPLYLKEAMGFSPYWASQALALTQGGAMIGRVGWGVASDRIFGGRRKIVLIMIGLLSIVLMTGIEPHDQAVIDSFTVGDRFSCPALCIVGYQGVSYALIGELAGKTRTGVAMGHDDHDQRRRGHARHAAVRLHRRSHGFLRRRLAVPCRRYRARLRRDGDLSQRDCAHPLA